MWVVIPVSQCKVTHNFDKTNIFSKNFWCALVFSRDFRRPKTAKFKIYLSFEACRASVVALSLGRWSCPLVSCGRVSVVVLSFRAVFPAFCPLYCFMFGGLLANMLLFAILRGFIWVYRLLVWVCVVLVVCVACGAFVRVWS